MRRTHLLVSACLLVAAGCKKVPTQTSEPDLCQRTVDHAMSIMAGVPGGGKMREEERAIASLAAAQSVATCRKEGLTQAQADCVLGVKDFEAFMAMGTCAALREKKPTWLILAPTLEEPAH
jgi:hypothetical protein